MSLLWLRVAVLLYGIAALAVLPAALYDRPRWRHVAIPATVAALLFHFVSLAEMLNAAHHSLPVDTHETQALLGLLLAAAFLLVYWRYKTASLTAGLLLGPLIAQETLGPSYFFDPKVLLSFAMWLAYVGMIYIRRHSGLRGRRAVYLSSFVFLVVLAVWAANQFSVVHRFTTPCTSPALASTTMPLPSRSASVSPFLQAVSPTPRARCFISPASAKASSSPPAIESKSSPFRTTHSTPKPPKPISFASSTSISPSRPTPSNRTSTSSASEKPFVISSA